jgi:hypothetical protein
VGAAGSGHRKRLQSVTVVSANGGGAGPLQDALGVLAGTDMVFLGQEHMRTGTGCKELANWYAARGWKAVVGAGFTTERGTSSGVFAACRSRLPHSLWPTALDSSLEAGRFTGMWTSVWLRGGCAFGSVYLETASGLGDNNLNLLWRISAWIRVLGCPIIIGGDWQVSPQVLRDSGWPAANGLTVVATGVTTCGDAELDYFVVSDGLAPYVDGVTIAEVGTSPHFGVRLKLTGKPREQQVRKLVRPRQMPMVARIGCAFRPPPDGVRDKCNALDKDASGLSQRWVHLVSALEEQHLARMGIGGDEAKGMSGRAAGHRWVWAPVLDRALDEGERLSNEGRAAKGMAHRISAYLHCKRKGAPLGIAVQRIRTFDGSALGPEWQVIRLAVSGYPEEEAMVLLREQLTKRFHACQQRAANARKTSWHAYLRGLMAKGSRGAFAFVKGHSFDQPRPYMQGKTFTFQEEVNEAACEWDQYCAATDKFTEVDIAWQTFEPLLRPSIKDVRKAAGTFPLWTGLGIDGLHMRVMESASDETVEAFIDLMELAEELGDIPGAQDVIIMVFLGKPDGGKRAIGLMSFILRLWFRIRRPEHVAWEMSHSRCSTVGVRGNTCEQANWDQCFTDEHALARGLASGSVLVDIRKCFEFVNHLALYREAAFQDYPWQLLRLEIRAFRSERRCRLGQTYSTARWASRSIVAGAGGATTLLRVLTLRGLDAAQQRYPTAILRNIVDDISVQAVHESPLAVADTLVGAATMLVADLQQLGFEVQVKKCATLSANDQVLKLVRQAWPSNFQAPCEAEARLLGSDYAAARRHSAAVRTARVIKFREQGGRLAILAAAGAEAATIASMGGIPGALWGVMASRLLLLRPFAAALAGARHAPLWDAL